MIASDPTVPHGRSLRVGMILYGELAYDSRVRREATTLAGAGHRVVLACVAGTEQTPDLPAGVEVLVCAPDGGPGSLDSNRRPVRSARGRLARRVHQARWLARYARNVRAWGRVAVAACGPVDVWHAHDLPALIAIAPVLSGGVPVVYDSHEIFVDAGTAAKMPPPIRLLLRAYEHRLVARVAAVVTVCDPFARVLRRRYQPRRLLVVYNAPPRWLAPKEKPDLLRVALGLQADVPIVLYHGLFSADRGLVQLTESMLTPGLDRAHLVFLGFGPMTDELAAISREPRFACRMHVLPGVPPDELLAWVASADVVAMPILPTTLNHRLTTPNKLLEALATGAPVVVSDTPGMAPIVVNDPAGPLGETCDPSDPSSIGVAIRRILELDSNGYLNLRRRCLAAAHARWNWETEAQKLLALYADLARDIEAGTDRSSRSAAGTAPSVT